MSETQKSKVETKRLKLETSDEESIAQPLLAPTPTVKVEDAELLVEVKVKNESEPGPSSLAAEVKAEDEVKPGPSSSAKEREPSEDLEDLPKKVYQLKITLQYSKPPIWRRIQVFEDVFLRNLHSWIQSSMGWHSSMTNYHLHQFEVGGQRIKGHKEVKMNVKDLFKSAKSCTYVYDFGDNWTHTVLLEKVLEQDPGKTYPVCVGGRRACPPEDAGGMYGYYEFLEKIADRNHDEHAEMMEWGESQGFKVHEDPANFDPSSVTFMDGPFADPGDCDSSGSDSDDLEGPGGCSIR